MTLNDKRKAIALGVCFIAINFLIETAVAHHFNPNPLSPLVWSVLAVVGGGALAVYVWLRVSEKGSA